MVFSTGMAFSTAPASPPTMIASVPALALAIAPDTGASIRSTSCGGKHRFQRARGRRIRRAHVDHHRAGGQRGQGFEHRFAHCLAVGQHGDERIGVLRGFANRGLVAGSLEVERLHREAGALEVRGHRHAHRAEADERYFSDWKTSFAARNATTAAGTPQ